MKKPTSTMYQLMRQSEKQDDDGMDIVDADYRDEGSYTKKFTDKYKDFYTDIKISIKEDW